MKMNIKMKMKIMKTKMKIMKMKMNMNMKMKIKMMMMNRSKKIIIKGKNDHLDEIIDKSKSFKDQIESLKKLENLEEYNFINNFGDTELKFKIFKLRLAHLSNKIDEDLFEQIFDHKFETLTDKLINTTNKEENQIIINSINKNIDKLHKKDKYDDWVI